MRALDITWPGILGTAFVFLVAAVCIRLGFWQLDRRDARLAVNQAVAERQAEPVLELDQPPRDTTGLTYRRARIGGTYDNDRAIILAGRSRGGAPGVHVFTPLRTAAGSALLVNRGWMPARDAATVDLATVRVDSPVVARGILMPYPDVDLDLEGDGFRTTWIRLDGEAIRRQYPYPVAPLYLQAAEEADGAGEAVPVPAEPPRLDPGPHLSYAIQWFSFAAIALIGWAALVLRSARSGPAPRPDPGV